MVKKKKRKVTSKRKKFRRKRKIKSKILNTTKKTNQENTKDFEKRYTKIHGNKTNKMLRYNLGECAEELIA